MMGLNFRYQFRAPAEVTAAELAAFLHRIEIEAQRMGFRPTAVINVQFDTAERVKFARRLGGSLWLQDERLNDSEPLGIARYVREEGACSLPPIGGVVLVVTNESGHEACFGFMKYPESIQTGDGRVVAESGLGESWWFEDYVQTPDARYRALVRRFVEAGFATRVVDDFAPETA